MRVKIRCSHTLRMRLRLVLLNVDHYYNQIMAHVIKK